MTQSSEHCGESRPHPAHKAMRGSVVFRCPGHEPTPPALRDLYAAAIASYDHAVGLATDPAPRGHHYGQADAALAVRDRELEERIRRECDRLQAAAVLADGEPHTDRERGIVAAVTRVLAALNPQEQS